MSEDDMPAMSANPLLESELAAVPWETLRSADGDSGYGFFLDPDPTVVSNALLTAVMVDPDRRRCRRMLTVLMSHDDETVRRQAAREAGGIDASADA